MHGNNKPGETLTFAVVRERGELMYKSQWANPKFLKTQISQPAK